MTAFTFSKKLQGKKKNFLENYIYTLFCSIGSKYMTNSECILKLHVTSALESFHWTVTVNLD